MRPCPCTSAGLSGRSCHPAAVRNRTPCEPLPPSRAAARATRPGHPADPQARPPMGSAQSTPTTPARRRRRRRPARVHRASRRPRPPSARAVRRSPAAASSVPPVPLFVRSQAVGSPPPTHMSVTSQPAGEGALAVELSSSFNLEPADDRAVIQRLGPLVRSARQVGAAGEAGGGIGLSASDDCGLLLTDSLLGVLFRISWACRSTAPVMTCWAMPNRNA